MTTNPNVLTIEICDSPDKAPHYNRDHVDIRAADLTKAVIVRNGMQSGKATVDFQFRSNDGAEFVAMLTGQLVKQLAAAVEGAEKRT